MIIDNVDRAVVIETMVDTIDEAYGAETFSFPFSSSTFQFPHTDYDEIVDTRRSSGRKQRKEVRESKDLEHFSKMYGNWKRGELDCDHRRRWRGYCNETTRLEKDIIFDSVAAARDVCTKMGGTDRIFNHCNVSEYRPTPMLSVEIVQGNDNPFTF